MQGKGIAFLNKEQGQKCWKVALKVLSYTTIVLLLLALFIQQAYRFYYKNSFAKIEWQDARYCFKEIDLQSGDLQHLEIKDGPGSCTLPSLVGQEEILYPAPRPEELGNIKNDTCINNLLNNRIQNDHLKGLLQKGFDKVMILNFATLYQGLKVSLNEFLRSYGDEKFTVAAVPNKSSYWMLQMALELGVDKVLERFTTYQTDTAFSNPTNLYDERDALRYSKEKIVIFDDGSYSGAQLVRAIRYLQENINNRAMELVLVIPFISNIAIQRIQEVSASSSSGLKVSLITTTQRIPTLQDTFTKKEISEIWQPGLGTYDTFVNSCLATTTWKLPDDHSFPRPFSKIMLSHTSREYPFGNPTPPYKPPN